MSARRRLAEKRVLFVMAKRNPDLSDGALGKVPPLVGEKKEPPKTN